jgi:hypothetical protein
VARPGPRPVEGKARHGLGCGQDRRRRCPAKSGVKNADCHSADPSHGSPEHRSGWTPSDLGLGILPLGRTSWPERGEQKCKALGYLLFVTGPNTTLDVSRSTMTPERIADYNEAQTGRSSARRTASCPNRRS